MNKDIRKNREALVRYFYGPIPRVDKLACKICAKKAVMLKFTGAATLPWPNTVPEDLANVLDINSSQLEEMESRFEGWKPFQKHSFSQIADWLQTLPGWPRVL